MTFTCTGADADRVTISDDVLLDNVSDLSRLSSRQLLERLVRTSERIEQNMSADSDYIQAALGSLDTAMTGLSARLDAQAQKLAEEAQAATDLAALQEVVKNSADKISQDAQAIGQMAPSQAADPGTPVSAPVVPEDPSQPIQPAPSDGGTVVSEPNAPADPAPSDPPVDRPADPAVPSDPGSDPAPSDPPVEGGADGPLPPASDGTDASGTATSASGDQIPTS